MSDIPAGRRKLDRGEHLFLGRTHKGAHRWTETHHPVAGDVVICLRCGRLRQGETMPISWEPIKRA